MRYPPILLILYSFLYYCHRFTRNHQECITQDPRCYTEIFSFNTSQIQSFSPNLQSLPEGCPQPPRRWAPSCSAAFWWQLGCSVGSSHGWDSQPWEIALWAAGRQLGHSHLQGISSLGCKSYRCQDKERNSCFRFGFAHLVFEINQ